MSKTLDRINRPAFVYVEIVKDCQYGKAGGRVQFSSDRAEQVVEAGYGKIVDQVDNKSMSADPRPAKARPLAGISNKAVGA